MNRPPAAPGETFGSRSGMTAAGTHRASTPSSRARQTPRPAARPARLVKRHFQRSGALVDDLAAAVAAEPGDELVVHVEALAAEIPQR